MNERSAPGWRLSSLAQLVVPIRSTMSPADAPADLPYIGLEHIVPGTGEFDTVPTGEAELRSAKNRFEAGDILYGKLRPNLRKCVVATSNGICSTDIVVLRPHIEESAYFIALQLRSANFAERVGRLVGGANLPRVNIRDLVKVEILYPPTDELQRLNRLAVLACEARNELRIAFDRVADVEHAVMGESMVVDSGEACA